MNQEKERQSIFNHNGRIKNSLKASLVGVISQIATLLASFIYRMIFIRVLSVEYLGINGLFTNILTLLSLAELGVGVLISFRLYDQIANDDLEKVAAIMNFYKRLYTIIAVIVLVAGIAIMPCLPFLIKDVSEIPADVNLYVVYALFLFQTVSSYLFVYRTTLLNADQNAYIASYAKTIDTVVLNSILIALLFLFKNYIVVLVVSIANNVLFNIILSAYVTKRYSAVFRIKVKIDDETKKGIYKDFRAIACHRIGGVVLTGTDNIVMSAFIGITVLGIYSNYSMVIAAVSSLMSQIFTSFVSSIGNANSKQSKDEFYKSYKVLNFINVCFTCWSTVCLFTLLSPFVTIWVGADLVLSKEVVALLCLSFFLTGIRNINQSYINATGLFVKDKWRPIVEASVNLIVSLVLAYLIGLPGIFIGTIISNLVTVFWREPILLHKFAFGRRCGNYFGIIAMFFLLSLGMAFGLDWVFGFMPNTLGFVALKFVIAIVFSVLVLLLLFWKRAEVRYLKNLGKRFLNKIFKKESNETVKIAEENAETAELKDSNEFIEDEIKEEDDYDDCD